MADRDGFDDLQERGEALGDALGDAATMAAAFDAQMKRISAAFEETGKDVATLERGMSTGLRKAFDGVVLDGMNLSEALDVLKNSMIRTAYSAAIKPVTDHFGGMLANTVGDLVQGLLPFADGGSFAQGRVMPFANGGVVTGPTMFPMRGATGLMGEAGPEAIMPLARGPDGKLGVRNSGGGGGVNVVMNITTPDVQGFRRSQGQIAAQMSRSLGRGNRNR